jgi:hypothetical protein
LPRAGIGHEDTIAHASGANIEGTPDMTESGGNLRQQIERRAAAGFRGYPIGTVAYYGPTDEFASKVVASIVKTEDSQPGPMTKWVSADPDVRQNAHVLRQVLDFLDSHGVRSVALTPGIYGCPHEEGLDYLMGGTCHLCPFWARRDRDAIFRRK